ncbi:MAG: sulfite exporter TauE/SafE family protein [Candidatus Colwellbacteria bacterium]
MEIIYVTILTIIAGGIGTLTGFGTSTIMVPVLLLFFPLAPTLLLVGIIHWFGDIWKIVLFRQGVRWRLIMLFGVPGVLLTFLGARLVFSVSEILLSQVLGGFLIAYVAFLFSKPSFKFKQNALTATTGGALSGFFAGVFGVGGAIRGAFLSAFDLPKAVYIATAGAIGLAIDTVRIGTYITGGTILPQNLLWGLLLFIPASFVGAHFAKKIVDRIPQKQFRMIIALFLLVVGIKLLLFP